MKDRNGPLSLVGLSILVLSNCTVNFKSLPEYCNFDPVHKVISCDVYGTTLTLTFNCNKDSITITCNELKKTLYPGQQIDFGFMGLKICFSLYYSDDSKSLFFKTEKIIFGVNVSVFEFLLPNGIHFSCSAFDWLMKLVKRRIIKEINENTLTVLFELVLETNLVPWDPKVSPDDLEMFEKNLVKKLSTREKGGDSHNSHSENAFRMNYRHHPIFGTLNIFG